MSWAVVVTPIGPIGVAVVDGVVRGASLRPTGELREANDPLLAVAVVQVREFFAGERTEFDLPLSLPDGVGGAFERAVWAELARIPYGEQRTYGDIAARLGEPGAARAVGTACNRNPLPLFLPCHRVVGAGGKLVGFGGGLASKRWLLEHEARVSLERAWG